MSSRAKRRASRRPDDRGKAGPNDAGRELGRTVRELRESLVAWARAFDRGEADLASHRRVIEAAIAVIELLDGDRRDELVESELDRATSEFASTMTLLLSIRHGADDAGGEDSDREVVLRESRRMLAADLLAFQALPLDARIDALLEDPPTVTLCAAALVAFGLAWDPLCEDAEVESLPGLVAGLAVARASLALADAADGEEPGRLFAAIDTAAVAMGALEDVDRDALLDAHGSVVWRICGAVAAGYPPEIWPAIVSSAAGLPVAFAAGAFGRDWLGELDPASVALPGEPDDEEEDAGPITDEQIAAEFRERADHLETVAREIGHEALRPTLAKDPLLAAYAAGRSWRAASSEADWREPWAELG